MMLAWEDIERRRAERLADDGRRAQESLRVLGVVEYVIDAHRPRDVVKSNSAHSERP